MRLFDLFQKSASLKINHKDKISLFIGKMTSFCIWAYLLYSFFMSDMIQKLNPIVLSQSFEVNERPSIALSKNNFLIAFALVDDENTIFPEDQTFFKFLVESYTIQSNEKKKVLKTNSSISEPCSEYYFERFPQEFTRMNLSQASCPIKKDIHLQGFWDEEELDFFYIRMAQCKNSTNNFDEVICKSEEEILNFFKNKYITFWIEQKNYDMENYANPSSSKLKYYSKIINMNFYQGMNLYLKKTIVQTNDGAIDDIPSSIESYSHADFDFDIGEFDPDYLFCLTIYSSETIQIFQRKYEKLFDCQFGWVIKLFIFFILYVCKFNNRMEN